MATYYRCLQHFERSENLNALKHRIRKIAISLLIITFVIWVSLLTRVYAASPVAYVPITMTNSESSAVVAGTQVRIMFNASTYSSYLMNDLGNIRFYRTNDWLDASRMYAWNENGTAATQTNVVFWLKLTDQIPSNSSLTVYMAFMQSGTVYDGLHWGQAPQLSNPYGRFDNGINVFDFYDNFAGTTLDSNKYKTSLFANDHCNIMPSVDNGLTVNEDERCNAEVITTRSFLLSSYTADFSSYWSQVGPGHSNGVGWNKDAYIGDFGKVIQVSSNEHTGSLYSFFGEDFSGPSGSSPNLFSICTDSSTIHGYWKYNQVANTPNAYSGLSYNVAAAWSLGGPTYTQWVRVRATPPNCMNPSSSFGIIKTLTTLSAIASNSTSIVSNTLPGTIVQTVTVASIESSSTMSMMTATTKGAATTAAASEPPANGTVGSTSALIAIVNGSTTIAIAALVIFGIVAAVLLTRSNRKQPPVGASTGKTEDLAPLDAYDTVDRIVLTYLQSHGGEISMSTAARDLGITELELKSSLSRLSDKGKIQRK
jgi:hypothetical protein